MKKTTEVDLQQIRKDALESQILALRTQSRVINTIATEHCGGISLGAWPSVTFILSQAEQLVTDTLAITELPVTTTADVLHHQLEELQTRAKKLNERSNRVDHQGEEIAEARLRQTIDEAVGEGEEAQEPVEIPDDPAGLTVQAGFSCYHAESEQYRAFTLQTQALSDLCLEIAFNAAADISGKRERVYRLA